MHGSANGDYVVDLTWYAAFCREPPEGKVLPMETTFTAEQARIIERLAWDVIRNYPDCGLYEEGTQPCGSPQFQNDDKVITLKSSTPGAWFRYTLDGTPPTRKIEVMSTVVRSACSLELKSNLSHTRAEWQTAKFPQ